MKYTPFLKSIAHHFYTHHRDELKQYRFYFQNRRAGLFFQHYIKEYARADGRTIILPQVTTLIDQLRHECSLPEVDVNNQLLVIYQLYLTLSEVGLDEKWESFSDFYQLGEYIINDFGDIDKHLKDPVEIYLNAADLAALSEDKSYIEDRQWEALKPFLGWAGSRDISEYKHEDTFVSLFSKMPEVYSLLKDRLRNVGLAYDGMTLREIYEGINRGERSLVGNGVHNVFVGLNALSEVERRLLTHYKEDPNTLFYWDYEGEAMKGKRIAGSFAEQNRRNFPPPEGEDRIVFDRVDTLPEIDLVSIPSKVAQAVYIGDNCIKQMYREWGDRIKNLQVAVVLPNERLLMPLLSNLPADFEYEVNVTMGYPLREMPLVGMLLRLIAILKQVRQRRTDKRASYWRGVEVKEILAGSSLDPVFEGGDLRTRITATIDGEKLFRLSEDAMADLWNAVSPNPDQLAFLKALFVYPPQEDADSHGGLWLLEYFLHLVELLMDAPSDAEEDQAIYTAEHSVLPFLRDLLRERYEAVQEHLEKEPSSGAFSISIMEDLLQTLFTYARIPYQGEPLRGLQVMGILETRGLDFDILLIPDATEGVLPGRSHLKSIIPHVIRVGAGLPTYKWHEQTRAYNFLRLISRASQLYCTYDSRRNNLSDGEPSRYFRLIDYIYSPNGKKVTYRSAGYPLRVDTSEVVSIRPNRQKFLGYRETIINGGKRHLSASAINDFLSCPLKFYAKRVEGIQDTDELSETLDSRTLGTLVHGTIEALYAQFEGRQPDLDVLQKWLDDPTEIESKYRECYRREFKRDQVGNFDRLFESGAHMMIRNVIKHDVENIDTFSCYVGGELRFKSAVPIPTGDTVNVIGYIDRMHLDAYGTLHIVDFKTGSDKANTLLNLEKIRKKNHNRAGIQLLLYALMLNDPVEYSTTLSGRSGPIRIPKFKKIIPSIYKPMTDEFFALKVDQTMAEDKSRFEEVENFADFEPSVQLLLEQAIAEIADPEQAFEPAPSDSACMYCPIAHLCPKAKKRV